MVGPEVLSLDGSWYCDGWSPNIKILHRVRETLYEGASPYQKIEVRETYDFGRLLIIDGLPQAAERDEMVYAKAIAWPALLAVPGPKRVLITGGGDGHVLREALRFPSVTSAIVCDIDPAVTSVTEELMPFMWEGVRADRRARVEHMDALELLAAAPPGSFEVVISDITDPTGEGTASHGLYSPEYFRSIRRCLVDGGVCVAQAQELSVKDCADHQRLRGLAAEVFGAVRSGQVYVPSFGYPEGFVFASDDAARLALGRAEIESGLRANGLDGDRYFDADVYEGMFALPPLVRAALGSPGR
jgi:spermidine synthase